MINNLGGDDSNLIYQTATNMIKQAAKTNDVLGRFESLTPEERRIVETAIENIEKGIVKPQQKIDKTKVTPLAIRTILEKLNAKPVERTVINVSNFTKNIIGKLDSLLLKDPSSKFLDNNREAWNLRISCPLLDSAPKTGPLHRQDVPGDGACLLYAMAIGLKKNGTQDAIIQSVKPNALTGNQKQNRDLVPVGQHLRNVAANYISDYSKKPDFSGDDPIYLDIKHNFGSSPDKINEYVENSKKTSFFCGPTQIIAVSKAYKVPVILWKPVSYKDNTTFRNLPTDADREAYIKKQINEYSGGEIRGKAIKPVIMRDENNEPKVWFPTVYGKEFTNPPIQIAHVGENHFQHVHD